MPANSARTANSARRAPLQGAAGTAGEVWAQNCTVDGSFTNMEKTEMSCNCDKNSGLLFFLTGLGLGVGLTALLAPLSGAATRRLIGRKVDEGEEWIKDKAAAAQDCVKGSVKDLRDRVEEMAR